MTAPIIGIDLGTTNSCAAFCDPEGNIKMIPQRGGDHLIPSIFAIDAKGNELVGVEAKRQWQLNPKNTVHGSKRMLGMNHTTEIVHAMKKAVSYSIADGSADDVVVQLRGTTFALHQISGKILAKIRDVASSFFGEPITRAVVTVPAYFNDRQRQAVRLAGKEINLEIVHVINEPTAAALAYGARENLEQTIAVYDLGGGTFDISIIAIRGRNFEVKGTGGDIFLGGLDFDQALIQYILAEFKSQHGVELSHDPVAMQRVRDAAERAKVDLSARTEVSVQVPFVTMTDQGKPLDIAMTITRAEFETLTAHLVDRTFDACASVMDLAVVLPEQIDAVLLVGGQTRMPIIHKRIKDFFGIEPSKTVHPDEAVAVGAALYAWSLDQRSDLKVQLLDVLPMAISIERADGALHQLFARNAGVPNQKMFTFTTHQDNQADLVMRLFQGDYARASDNTLLGEFTFTGLRAGKAGTVQVEVVFQVSSEGILSLEAHDHDTHAAMKHTVRLDSH